MNKVIDWLATNNTLMIKIGFTSVLLLMVVYAFRFFFVPRINVVAGAEEDKPKSDSKKEKSEKKQKSEDTAGAELSEAVNPAPETSKLEGAAVEQAPAKTEVTEAAAAAVATGNATDSEEFKQKLQEIQKLKDENAQLKTQASEAQSKVTELESKLTAAKADVTASAVSSAAATSTTGDADPKVVSELNKKIEQLESRLSEYEIIAEEISEISELKKENAQLKKQLESSGPVAPESASVVSEPTPEQAVAAQAEPEPEPEPTSEPAVATEASDTPAETAAPAPAESETESDTTKSQALTAEEIQQIANAEVAATAEILDDVSKINTGSSSSAKPTEDVSEAEMDLLKQFEEASQKKG